MENRRLEDILENRSFVRWIKGECSAEEEEYWGDWIQEHPEHRVLVRAAKDVVGAVNSEYEIPNHQVELEKLNREIDRYEDRRASIRLNKYKRVYRKSRGPVAAVVVFLVMVLGTIFAYQFEFSATDRPRQTQAVPVKQYQTDYGEKLTFRLSDGSRIVLNSNSNLRFSSKIEEGLNAEVWLDGEAYFNIVHLEKERKRTFRVHTDDGSIRVLGTRFAVNTFGAETQAVLEEGTISVRIKGGTPDSSVTYRLESGEMARFVARDNKITVKKVDTRIYTSWTQNRLIFDRTPMMEIARRIHDTFGIKVELDQRLSDETLSGSIKSDNLEVLTEALSKILNADIIKQDQKLIIEAGKSTDAEY